MALKRFEKQGIRVKEDTDQAWLDYAGWRVNYDSVLIGLLELTMSPSSKWFSDQPPVDVS
jgi:hypothetical protein